MSDDLQPSDKVMKFSKKVEGTKSLMLMVAYDQIETAVGADPPDSMMAMALNLAIGADAILTAINEDVSTVTQVLNDGNNRQKLMDAIELLEHTVSTMKEAMNHGQH